MDHATSETLLLVVVHAHHPLPVLCHLRQTIRLRQVHQVQHVLLEARTTVTHRRLQEAAAHTRIRADRTRHLRHVRAHLLAHCRNGVDRGDALCEEGVGGQLRQLGRPRVHRDDAILRHPHRVDVRQRLHGSLSRLRVLASNQHAVRVEEIIDGSTLSEELGVVDHLQVVVLVVLGEDATQRSSRSHRNCRLLHLAVISPSISCNDLVTVGDHRDGSGSEFEIAEIRSAASANAERLRGGLLITS